MNDTTQATTKPEAVALEKATDAYDLEVSWDYYWSPSGLEAACWAFYKHMISSSPGLQFHEADGTVRLPTSRDI